MITPNFYMDGEKYCKGEVLWGLSSESKPTSVANGSAFIEMDSSKVYFFDATNSKWFEWGAETEAESNAETTDGGEGE